MRAAFLWTCAAALMIAPAAQAQDWATRAVCDVDTPRLHAEIFEFDALTAYRTEASFIPNSVGRFWQITAPGGAVSHLWGTMHVSHPDVLRLPDAVETALQAAQAVAVETDYTYDTRAEISQSTAQDHFYQSDGDSFRMDDLLIPDDVLYWISLRHAGLGWSAAQVDQLSPSGVASLTMSHPCDDFIAGAVPYQDQRIQMIGHMNRAKIIGLEPDLAFNDKLNDPANLEIAAAIIATYGTYLQPTEDNRGNATSLHFYLTGNTGISIAWDKDYIIQTLGPELGPRYHAAMVDYLLTERNHVFLTNAEAALQAGGLFMAVGNFHLPGEAGMVALLRDAGYEVTRIVLPGEVPG